MPFTGGGAGPAAKIASGTSFPTPAAEGDCFYRTDLNEFYVYDGTDWVRWEIETHADEHQSGGADAIPQPINKGAYNWRSLGTVSAERLEAMGTDGDGVWIVTGLEQVIYRTPDNGESWSEVGTTESSINPNAVDTDEDGVWCIAGNETAGAHVYRSTDNGKSWTDLGAIATDAGKPLATDKEGIWVFGDAAYHLFRSTDNGSTWTDLGAILTDRALGIAAGRNGVWIATDLSQHVFRSSDDGSTWTDLGAITAGNPNDVDTDGLGVWCIVCDDGHIWRSTDNGSTWTDLGAVSDAMFHTVATDEKGTWVAVTDNGKVYRSLDNGSAWSLVGTPAGSVNLWATGGTPGIFIISDENGKLWKASTYTPRFSGIAHAPRHESGGADELFDQSLNTTDDVQFSSVTVGDLTMENGWRFTEDDENGVILKSPEGKKFKMKLEEMPDG